MICPSCKKSGPAGFRCRSCGAELLAARYREDPPGTSPPPFALPPRVIGGTVAVENPYSAPLTRTARPASRSQTLATRDARLVAVLIDTVAAILVLVPAFSVAIFAGSAISESVGVGLLVILVGFAFLGFCIYQIQLLVREGQTLGKKWMKIRIVNYDDGTIPSAGRLLGLRYLVPGILGNIIPLFSIVDVLFIFGMEQRCLHDHLAGTKVVRA